LGGLHTWHNNPFHGNAAWIAARRRGVVCFLPDVGSEYQQRREKFSRLREGCERLLKAVGGLLAAVGLGNLLLTAQFAKYWQILGNQM